MKLGGAAQGLAGADVAGALTGVVDEDDGKSVAALQVAQICQQGSDVAADVLVDAVQPDEGIEDEQAWLERGNGLFQAFAVGLDIETQAGRGDDLDVDIGEADAGGGTDAVEAAPDDMRRVLGGIEEDPARPGHGEAAQAGSAGGDRDGQVEGEEGFAALRLAADDADGL